MKPSQRSQHHQQYQEEPLDIPRRPRRATDPEANVGGGQRTRDRFSRLLFLRNAFEQDQKQSRPRTQNASSAEESESSRGRDRGCIRQSSEPTLPVNSSLVPTSSTTSNSLSCSMTSKSSVTSTQSSIGSSWEERKKNRNSQTGPNPFAFF